ncbi:hypothetical protein Scep_004801 [Stephania cephalantha]|uniref:Uncharacterized protein n=1 Tax=Stephania cephalantha TaxID=152367 RepID=A0AAP0PVR3_9MAGN
MRQANHRHPNFRNPQPIPAYDSDSDEDMFALPRQQGHHPQQFQRGDGNDYKIKINVPYFDGHLHIEDFLDSLNTVEKFFDCMDVPEDKQVKIVAYKLRGGASALWD